jgi:hypothetical protein
MAGRRPQVRIIAGPRNTVYDQFIRALVNERGYGHERIAVGCEDQAEADRDRRGLREAGRHLGVSVRSFWRAGCEGCPAGGPACRFHVHYTVFRPEAAARYMARKTQ